MRIYQATAAGRKHTEAGEPNQDWCKAVSLFNGFAAAAVLDGVSSVPHAERGSEIGGRAFIKAVEFCLEPYRTDTAGRIADEKMREILRNAAVAAWNAIVQRAQREGERTYATTLHGVIFHEPSRTAWVLHAGDGAVLALHMDGTFTSTETKKHTGEIAGSVIPLTGGEQHWEYIKFEQVSTVILTTDGLLPLLQPTLLSRFGDLLAYPQAVLPLVDERGYTAPETPQTFVDELVGQNLSYADHRRRLEKLLMACGCTADAVDDMLTQMRHGDFSYLLQVGRDDRTLVVLQAEGESVRYHNGFLGEPDWEKLEARRNAVLYRQA